MSLLRRRIIEGMAICTIAVKARHTARTPSCVTQRSAEVSDPLDHCVERDLGSVRSSLLPSSRRIWLMRFRICRGGLRAPVVECAIFATPKLLKFQLAQNI